VGVVYHIHDCALETYQVHMNNGEALASSSPLVAPSQEGATILLAGSPFTASYNKQLVFQNGEAPSCQSWGELFGLTLTTHGQTNCEDVS
jgi:hypothetical protein